MKLYKSGLALKREGTDETVAAFINEQDLDNVLEAVMTKKKPNKPVPGDESNERMAMPSAARDAALEEAIDACKSTLERGAEFVATVGGCISAISALKSIAGPVADTPTITYGPKVNVTITEHNEYGQPVLRGPFTATAPAQQAAPSDAVAAMNRAKKLPIWDSINHDLHVELDIIFKSLAAPAHPASPSDDRIAALEAKCDLLEASLRQADAENAQSVGLSDWIRASESTPDDGLYVALYYCDGELVVGMCAYGEDPAQSVGWSVVENEDGDPVERHCEVAAYLPTNYDMKSLAGVRAAILAAKEA